MAEERPTVRRRRLGMLMRRIREERGLTIPAAARMLNRSPSSVSKLETGQRGIRIPSLENMLDRYGVTDQDLRDTLFRLTREGSRKGWWQGYGGTISPELMDFLSLEADSTFIGFFELVLIPGLLQTREYARALIGIGPFAHDPQQVDRLVDLRMKRQQILSRPEPPVFRVIVDEAALRREVGGPHVMRAQLRRLVEVSSAPRVTLQVLPFSLGQHQGMDGSFKILHVGDHGDLPVVVVDSLTQISYREEEQEIRGYSDAFDRLCDAALSADDSRALIERLSSTL